MISPVYPTYFLYKVGFSRVLITQTCQRDATEVFMNKSDNARALATLQYSLV